MRKMWTLDHRAIIMGTAREIRNVVHNLSREPEYSPLYTDTPKFNSNRMYAVEIERHEDFTHTWSIINADTIVRYMVDGILVDWDEYGEEVS